MMSDIIMGTIIGLILTMASTVANAIPGWLDVLMRLTGAGILFMSGDIFMQELYKRNNNKK